MHTHTHIHTHTHTHTHQSTELSKQDIEELEIDRSQIRLIQRLGAGQFGEVWEGLWNNMTSVAVKTLSPGTMSTSDFLQEARLMMRLHHPNIVQLYAVCTREEPVYIVTELMKHGSLLQYLRQGEGRSLKLPQLINMASQVASGMSYLTERNIVHLDLAARNVHVGGRTICKMLDFQLARVLEDGVHIAPEGFKFPIKWTAPESFLDYRVSIKSDVWSFGVMLYEIVTYGQFPYPSMSNVEVLEKVQTGYRMGCPPNCPQELHDIMMDCWHQDPASRPNFKSLLVQLQDFLTSTDAGYEADA